MIWNKVVSIPYLQTHCRRPLPVVSIFNPLAGEPAFIMYYSCVLINTRAVPLAII